jgi:molybdate transport system substrate-binding protein
MKALSICGLSDLMKKKMVNSQDIAQAFQYTATEAVDAGFCALSAAYSRDGKSGCFYRIKEAPVIIQSACIIKKSKNRKAVLRFAEFLVSKDAEKIKAAYGYK